MFLFLFLDKCVIYHLIIYSFIFMCDLTGQTSFCTHVVPHAKFQRAFCLPCSALTSQFHYPNYLMNQCFTVERVLSAISEVIETSRVQLPLVTPISSRLHPFCSIVICSDRTLPFWKNFTFAAPLRTTSNILSWQGHVCRESHAQKHAPIQWLKHL